MGLLTWVALHWMGLENAGARAVAAGLMHAIPYAGTTLTATILGTAAFMQLDSFSVGLLTASVSLTTTTFISFINEADIICR